MKIESDLHGDMQDEVLRKNLIGDLNENNKQINQQRSAKFLVG